MSSFKRLMAVLGLALFSAIQFACNKQIPCDDATSILSFVSFPVNETDPIIVRRYARSANFSTPIDTFLITSQNCLYVRSNDTLEVRYAFGGDNGLKSKYDYEVFLPQASRTFRISEIDEEKSFTSGGGLFSMDRRGCVNRVRSYKLNGQLVSGNYSYYWFYIHH